MSFKLGELVQAIYKDKIVEGKVLRKEWLANKLTGPSFYQLETSDGKPIVGPNPEGFPAEVVFKLDFSIYKSR
jgi:hypothetical protein